MLQLTENAIEMIQTLTAEADLPDGGLRIAQEQEQEHPGLVMELSPAPREQDYVLPMLGVRLFLDQVAATRLQGQTLDARSNEAGSAFFLVA